MENNSSGGIGLSTLLAVVFIVLKLCHVINWSWWIVLAPIYGPMVLYLLVVIILIILDVLI